MPELVLVTPIHLGRQYPGMLIEPELTILPNRFVPVLENGEGVFYQAVAPFKPQWGGERSENVGGLYLDKVHPEKVWAYVGDARSARFMPHLWLPLMPEDVRRLKVARPAKPKQ